MTIYEKLSNIQSELKAPKSQYNSFGKYSYRSCEDILEAVKPICKNNKAVCTINDEIVLVGDRYYVKATAWLIDTESGERINNIAYAREEDEKKGMDGSQVTGASSSYARKYALNGLFAIDDTKDSDATNKGEDKPKTSAKQEKSEQPKQAQKTQPKPQPNQQPKQEQKPAETFQKLTKTEIVTKYGVKNVEATIAWFEERFGIPFDKWDEDATTVARSKLEDQKKKREAAERNKEAEYPFPTK